MKKKVLKIVIIILLILIVVLGASLFYITSNSTELKSIKSKAELERIYNYDYSSYNLAKYILGMPFSILINSASSIDSVTSTMGSEISSVTNTISGTAIDSVETSSTSSSTSSTKDYSTTNIQVENVDEADIIKTDGDYIYSISEYDVVITNVQDPENPVIMAKIEMAERSTRRFNIK